MINVLAPLVHSRPIADAGATADIAGLRSQTAAALRSGKAFATRDMVYAFRHLAPAGEPAIALASRPRAGVVDILPLHRVRRSRFTLVR